MVGGKQEVRQAQGEWLPARHGEKKGHARPTTNVHVGDGTIGVELMCGAAADLCQAKVPLPVGVRLCDERGSRGSSLHGGNEARQKRVCKSHGDTHTHTHNGQ